MTSPYKLYGRAGSGSFAVQVALEEIGAPYERIWVGRGAAELAKFREINPTAKVPALLLPDGTLMFESAAMLIQLALAHPKSRLAPAPGSSAYALFLQWMVFLSANVYESALRFVYPERYSSRGESDADAVRRQAEADFLAHLRIVSQHLRPYVLGADYSIADVYLYMLASWSRDRAELNALLPSLGAHSKLIAGRAAVVKVEPEHAE